MTKKHNHNAEYTLIAQSKYFNRKWYLKTYPDVKQHKADPILHYLNHGWHEGRNPSQEFDTNVYLKRNPDIKQQKICPLLHYEQFGKYENRKIKEMDYLSVVTIMRNEGKYVKEWLDYHILVGVERFYIYDNESTDNLADVLEPYIKQGIVVYKYFPGDKKNGIQAQAYMDCIQNYKNETQWLAIIDADEFIVPMKHNTVPELLKDYESVPGLSINWLMFDSNGHDKKPRGGVLENYTRCNPDYQGTIIKSIVNPRMVSYPEGHCCRYKDAALAVDENFRPVPHGNETLFPHTNKIRINHYWTKSKEEYLAKIKKPRCNGQPLQQNKTHYAYNSYTYDYFVYKFVKKMPHKNKIKEFFRKYLILFKQMTHKSEQEKFFNKKYYENTYPEVKNFNGSAYEHYMTVGWTKGYNPSKKFCTQFYLDANPDIKDAKTNPFWHYTLFGFCEKRICKPQEQKNKDPKISVIVASYNYEKLIKETLDSLVAQTYKNFEVIIVDDGSTDNSIDVIKQYSQKHNNFFVYTHENGKNLGLCETIKLGIEKASGEYIAFCESDDIWTANHLSQKAKFIKKHKSSVIISNDLATFGDNRPDYQMYLQNIRKLLRVGRNNINITKYKYNMIPTFSAVTIKKSVLQDLNFDSYIPAWTDWWLYRQILSKHPLYYINKKLTKYRLHKSYNDLEQSSKQTQNIDVFLWLNDHIIQPKQSDPDVVKTLDNTEYFDKKWYIKQHPEITKYNADAAQYFHDVGWKRMHNPSEKFSTRHYLGLYPDIKNANIDPLIHFVWHGQRENRIAVPVKHKPKIYKNKLIPNADTILLASHILNHTGAPILLLSVAKLMQEHGYNVVIMSPVDGDLTPELVAAGITVIVDPVAFIDKDVWDYYKKYKFKFAICNTYINAKIYSIIRDFIPSILWVHDNVDETNLNIVYETTNKTADIFVPSTRTKKIFEQKFNNVQLLSYPIYDQVKNIKTKQSTPLKIAVCATIQPRKGQDVFINAIKKLKPAIRKRAEFIIVGENCFPDFSDKIRAVAKNIREIKFIDGINNLNDYHKFMNNIDVLCCPSREDPYPLVVIDAMMHGKIPVISTHVGQCDIITHGQDGFVFQNENEQELANILQNILTKCNITKIQKNSKRLFHKTFSCDIWFNQIEKIMDEKCKK